MGLLFSDFRSLFTSGRLGFSYHKFACSLKQITPCVTRHATIQETREGAWRGHAADSMLYSLLGSGQLGVCSLRVSLNHLQLLAGLKGENIDISRAL